MVTDSDFSGGDIRQGVYKNRRTWEKFLAGNSVHILAVIAVASGLSHQHYSSIRLILSTIRHAQQLFSGDEGKLAEAVHLVKLRVSDTVLTV